MEPCKHGVIEDEDGACDRCWQESMRIKWKVEKREERRAQFASMFLAAYCGNPYLIEELQKAKGVTAGFLVEDAIGLADRLIKALGGGSSDEV